MNFTKFAVGALAAGVGYVVAAQLFTGVLDQFTMRGGN
jgi:hypothetical protein|tara:strand:- start:3291 stop:3404 length:114 start_codon:yes stop_codon:yes gene_type:complete